MLFKRMMGGRAFAARIVPTLIAVSSLLNHQLVLFPYEMCGNCRLVTTDVLNNDMVTTKTQYYGSIDTRESVKEDTMNHNKTATTHVAKVKNCTAPLLTVQHDMEHKEEDADVAHQGDTANRVPRNIHVTSISRCMTAPYADNMKKWRFPGHSVLIHDDEDVNKLFASSERWSRYFSLLSDALLCLPRNGTSSAAKSDVWRYLVLWDQGGLYTDVDNVPGTQFAQGTANMDPEDDALIALNKRGRPYSSFLVMNPKHPLMYIALNIAIERLLALENLAEQRFFYVTGPGALHTAFEMFTGVNIGIHINTGLYRWLRPALSKQLAWQFPSEGVLDD
jgi:mannosyltransferase OCH1-like enzyme